MLPLTLPPLLLKISSTPLIAMMRISIYNIQTYPYIEMNFYLCVNTYPTNSGILDMRHLHLDYLGIVVDCRPPVPPEAGHSRWRPA